MRIKFHGEIFRIREMAKFPNGEARSFRKNLNTSTFHYPHKRASKTFVQEPTFLSTKILSAYYFYRKNEIFEACTKCGEIEIFAIEFFIMNYQLGTGSKIENNCRQRSKVGAVMKNVFERNARRL